MILSAHNDLIFVCDKPDKCNGILPITSAPVPRNGYMTGTLTPSKTLFRKFRLFRIGPGDYLVVRIEPGPEIN